MSQAVSFHVLRTSGAARLKMLMKSRLFERAETTSQLVALVENAATNCPKERSYLTIAGSILVRVKMDKV